MEKSITIGSGKMGKLLAGNEAVSLRQTESFAEHLSRNDFVVLTTRQDAGLLWLKNNSRLLQNKLVISLMAFVEFEALEKAVKNDSVRFVRIMTDTSLKKISWSDDGKLSVKEKVNVQNLLERNGESKVEYLGVKADSALLLETIKACQLGWVAQALAELTANVDQEVLEKVLDQQRTGLTFAEIANRVATPNGATEAGIKATQGLFTESTNELFKIQLDAGLTKAKEKSKYFNDFVRTF